MWPVRICTVVVVVVVVVVCNDRSKKQKIKRFTI